MKTIITLLAALLISISSFAQQGINYKAVIKDAGGNVLANQNMKVRFIIKNSKGSNIHVDTHTTTSNANGIIILNIGEGTPGQFQDFNTIDWGDDNYTLVVGIDPEMDGTYINFEETEFKKVPYALHANKADFAASAESATFRTEDNITSNSPGDLNSDDFVFGSTQLDNGVTSGNSRMFFDKSKASFRAGRAAGVEWDDVNVGNRSVAFGLNTIASGSYSTALGNRTRAEAYASTAIGAYNKGGGNPSAWVDTDPLFEIGNGTATINTENRNNALTVLKNGNTHIGGKLSLDRGLVLGDFAGASDPGSIAYYSGTSSSGFYGYTDEGLVQLGGKRHKTIVIPSAAFNLCIINEESIDKISVIYTALSVRFKSFYSSLATGPVSVYLVAPISLPANSKIFGISYVFNDNEPDVNYKFNIIRDCSLTNESPEIVTNDYYDVNAPNYTFRSNNTINETIGPNCQYIMTIEIPISGPLGLGQSERLKFYRARIDYIEE